MKAQIFGVFAAALWVALPTQLWAQQNQAPDVTQQDDLGGLIDRLRGKLGDLREGDSGEIPLGQLAKELDQARRDIERLAELILRNEITEIRQQSTLAQAVHEIEALSGELENAESRIASLQDERTRMEAFVAESAERVDELASELIAADDAKRALELAVEGSLAEATAARSELQKASERIAKIDNEIELVILEYDQRAKVYEAELAQASSQVSNLENRLRAQESAFQQEISAKNNEIANLAASQVKARNVLVEALAEFDEVTNQTVTAYEREMLRSAEASSQAREDILDDLGFRRNSRGELLPPSIELGQVVVDANAVEDELGSADQACVDKLEVVDRPYLDDKASEDWEHLLVGSLRFDEAATRMDRSKIKIIVDCLASLSHDETIYFKLIGHTDAKGAASFNKKLSLARAQAVRDVFGDYIAIQPWRLFAQGRGEDYPLADNESEAGREQNRRVEIFAVRAIF